MKTDTQLQQDVMAELKWDPSVHAAQIGVEARDGVVTLSGEVSSFGEKWNAERAAQRVAGVAALAVELQVRLSALGSRSDADIARSAENVLQWTTSLPEGAVQVMVEGGWVTLTGSVDWQYQRQTAADGVRYLVGVRGLSDQITIKPQVSVNAVKTDIESALKRRAANDASSIGVDVDGANVTLTGSVNTWSERELAIHSAWSTPGVRNVIDRMKLVL